MLWFIKKTFIEFLSLHGSLPSMFNVSSHTKCIYLNSQPFMTRPTVINLNLDEYNRGLCYYSFAANLDG